MGAALTYTYVRENPAPKWPDKVQYLHFKSLKLLVTIGPTEQFCIKNCDVKQQPQKHMQCATED